MDRRLFLKKSALILPTLSISKLLSNLYLSEGNQQHDILNFFTYVDLRGKPKDFTFETKILDKKTNEFYILVPVNYPIHSLTRILLRNATIRLVNMGEKGTDFEHAVRPLLFSYLFHFAEKKLFDSKEEFDNWVPKEKGMVILGQNNTLDDTKKLAIHRELQYGAFFFESEKEWGFYVLPNVMDRHFIQAAHYKKREKDLTGILFPI